MSGIKPGDKVIVLGAGPIGLAVAFWARRAGAGKVIMQDVAPHQRDRALEMGATDFIVDREDPVGASTRALGGLADIVFECVGIPGLIAQAVQQLRGRGTIVLLGLCNLPDTFNSFAMLSKEIRLITSAFFTSGEYEAALDALDRGAAEPRALVTETVSTRRHACDLREPQAPHPSMQGADRTGGLTMGWRRTALLLALPLSGCIMGDPRTTEIENDTGNIIAVKFDEKAFNLGSRIVIESNTVGNLWPNYRLTDTSPPSTFRKAGASTGTRRLI